MTAGRWLGCPCAATDPLRNRLARPLCFLLKPVHELALPLMVGCGIFPKLRPGVIEQVIDGGGGLQIDDSAADLLGALERVDGGKFKEFSWAGFAVLGCLSRSGGSNQCIPLLLDVFRIKSEEVQGNEDCFHTRLVGRVRGGPGDFYVERIAVLSSSEVEVCPGIREAWPEDRGQPDRGSPDKDPFP